MEWSWDVEDRMSAKLAKIDKALAHNQTAMKTVGAEAKKIERAMALEAIAKEKDPLKARLGTLKLFQQDITEAKERLDASREAVERSREKWAKFLDIPSDKLNGWGAMKAGIIGVTGAVLGMTAGIAALGVKLASTVVEQSEFRQESLRTLETMLGTKDAAEAEFKMIERMSQSTGKSKKELVETFNGLVSQGLTKDNANDVIAAMADIKAKGGEGASDKYLEIFKKTVASTQDTSTFGRGVFDEGSFRDLNQLGKGTQDIFLKTIAAQHHTTTNAARLLIANGMIRAQEGLQTIQDIVENNISGGRFGSAANAVADASPTQQMDRIHKNLLALFETGGTSPLAGALGRVADVLDPASDKGKKLQGVLAGLFDRGAQLIDKFASDPDALGRTFDKVVGAVQTAIAVVDTFAGAVEFMAGVWQAQIDAVGFVLFTVMDTFDDLKAVGTAAVDFLFSAFGDFEPMAREVAGHLIDGLIYGLTGGMSALGNAIDGLGGAMIDGMKKKLGINSPSRVMMELGGHTAEGFALGVEGGRSAELASIIPSVSSPGGRAGGMASGAGGGNQISVTVHVDASGAKDPEAVGRATAEAVRSEIMGFLESIALESGAMGVAA